MAESQGKPNKQAQESLDLAREAATLIVEGKMPSFEEIERVARESMAEVRRQHPEWFKGKG